MPTETQHLEQRVAALQSDLNARDQALDDAATESNERELSRRDWFEEAQRLQAELHELTGKWERFEEFEHGLQAKLAKRDALLERCRLAVVNGEDFDLPASLLDEIKALSASAEPKSCGACAGCEDGCRVDRESPQVERDERAEFEVAYSGEYGTPLSVLRLLREGDAYIERPQHSDRLNSSWWMWQARADLERKS